MQAEDSLSIEVPRLNAGKVGVVRLFGQLVQILHDKLLTKRISKGASNDLWEARELT